MGTFQSFEEIDAWQKARQLTEKIYEISKQDSFFRDFPLKDQIRRASASIMSNIAEGFDRGGTREFVQFLSVAKGSASEVRSHLYIALDQEYISQGKFDELTSLSKDISNMIGGLLIYLKKSGIKGRKFK